MQLVLLVLVLFAVYWFFLRTERFGDMKTSQAIPPSVIEKIIAKITAQRPALFPLETVFLDNFYDKASGATTVSGRFMFLDKESYSGVQYDVNALVLSPTDVQILDITSTVSPELSGPFLPYGKASYIKYSDVLASVQSVLEPAAGNTWLNNSNKI